MDKKKEIHHGTKTLFRSGGSAALTIPKKYVDRHGLEIKTKDTPGTGVEMIERGDELVIRPAGGKASGTTG